MPFNASSMADIRMRLAHDRYWIFRDCAFSSKSACEIYLTVNSAIIPILRIYSVMLNNSVPSTNGIPCLESFWHICSFIKRACMNPFSLSSMPCRVCWCIHHLADQCSRRQSCHFHTDISVCPHLCKHAL